MTDERLVSASEMAEILGVHKQTVYDYAAAGTIPSYRVGRAVRFKPSEVQEALKANK